MYTRNWTLQCREQSKLLLRISIFVVLQFPVYDTTSVLLKQSKSHVPMIVIKGVKKNCRLENMALELQTFRETVLIYVVHHLPCFFPPQFFSYNINYFPKQWVFQVWIYTVIQKSRLIDEIFLHPTSHLLTITDHSTLHAVVNKMLMTSKRK